MPFAHVRDPVGLGPELGVAGGAAVRARLDLAGVGPEEMVVERLAGRELRVAARQECMCIVMVVCLSGRRGCVARKSPAGWQGCEWWFNGAERPARVGKRL